MKFYSSHKIIATLYLLSHFFCLNLKGQDKTINTSGKNNSKEILSKHKIMLIPFEPRMYLSEIDYQINQESKLTGKQIKATMRDGLNEQLYKKLKSKMGVIDLLDDTVKTKKDLENIYQYLTYQYQKIPDQQNYKVPAKEQTEKKINNGQITIESDHEARFMNAKLKNASLVPSLYAKYKTNLFLFINELDIKALNGSPGDLNAATTRKIILHYTIFTVDAKEINSGIAEVNLPTTINNPSKIISTYFSQIADVISVRLEKSLMSK